MPDSTPKRNTRSGSSSSNITLSDIKSLIESARSEIIQTVKSEIESLKTTVNALQENVKQLEGANKLLQASFDHIKTEVDALRSSKAEFQQKSIEIDEFIKTAEYHQRDVYMKLSEEISEQTRKKCNFVISGVAESSSNNSDNSSNDDNVKCVEILNKIGCNGDGISEVHRIGRQSADRPRLLMVKSKSEAFKEDVLRKAKNLRNHPNFHGIYLNPDRTHLQQLCRKSLLEELNRRKDEGEDVVIFRNRVVQKRQIKNF